MADAKSHELRLAIVNAETEEEKNAAIKAHNDYQASQVGKNTRGLTPSATYGRLLQVEAKSETLEKSEVATSEAKSEAAPSEAKPTEGNNAE